jgi:GMP synthase (glutamine-hydrolysing)
VAQEPGGWEKSSRNIEKNNPYMIPYREKIVVLDFGSQYTQLIARRIRALSVFSEILPFTTPISKVKDSKGIILSGGPYSVFDKDAPKIKKTVLKLGIPILGICYGHQLLSHFSGGKVSRTTKREYGHTVISIDKKDEIFTRIPRKLKVWMSHGDKVIELPPDFIPLAHSENTRFAAVRHKSLPLYGLQFHPEVTHTHRGDRILSNFVHSICECSGEWNMDSFIATSTQEIRKTVGDRKVILGLSGGIDSAVSSILLKRAIGKNLYVIFINNGLLRKDESSFVIKNFKGFFGKNFIFIDAEREFLNKLKGVREPERKRKIIGRVFVKIFEREARKLKGIEFLAQGTLYPDRIESRSIKGPSSVIKSHHNVGGLPEKMDLRLVEPLKDLFKDEVRELGQLLGLPVSFISRHPFPGPGLSVRIIGEITKKRLSILREADRIFIEEIKRSKLYKKIWQAFCVLLPVKTVGVMGDKRTYENVLSLRAVTSEDGMTADWYPFSKKFLTRVSTRIINEVEGINRIVYDISSKPPATIEWE